MYTYIDTYFIPIYKYICVYTHEVCEGRGRVSEAPSVAGGRHAHPHLLQRRGLMVEKSLEFRVSSSSQGPESGLDCMIGAMFAGPPEVLRGGISKSILQGPCQFLAINAHIMAPRTNQWLQERTWNAPTKGLLWLASSPALP